MKINLLGIPKNPGCYLFKNKSGKVIYIGKAKNLSNRVKSYFQHRSVYSKDRNSGVKQDLGSKTDILVSNIDSVEFFITDNEVESLILENNLIKKYKPKYNISLKDSKRYAFIQITNEEYPRLLVARKRENNGRYYGPFVSGLLRDYIIEVLRKTFKIRTCKRLPKKECLRYSIGLCSAPCISEISKENYLQNIKSVELVLKGKVKNLVKILNKRMKEYSKEQKFENAIEARNQIIAVKTLEEKQKMERNKQYDEDVINYIIEKDKVYLMLFNSRNGILENKIDFEFSFKKNFLEEFLTMYYGENKIPSKIILPNKVDDVIEVYLRKIKGKKVSIEIPKKGVSKDLLNLVKKNLELMLFGDYKKIEDLAKELKFNELPRVIECFDISHLSGTDTVASMVQFRNGKANKNNYRRYKINTVDKIDDFAAMKEVVFRRYSKLKKENLPMPNLILIDGGKGQLSSVMEVLDKLELKLVVISLAKREEEIFVPGRKSSIMLPRKGEAFLLVCAIRDEAHRFAINYNRLRRKKAMFE